MSESNSEFIKKLKAGDRKAYLKLYEDCYQTASIYIMNKKGSTSDVEDVFQEALMVLVKKLRDPSFNLDVLPQTYLKAVVKKMWLYRLRGKKEDVVYDEQLEVAVEDEILEKEVFEQKHDLVFKAMDKLKEDCQKVLLSFYYKKMRLADIAEEMGFTSNSVKVKKNRCMNKLRELVKEDPNFKNL